MLSYNNFYRFLVYPPLNGKNSVGTSHESWIVDNFCKTGTTVYCEHDSKDPNIKRHIWVESLSGTGHKSVILDMTLDIEDLLKHPDSTIHDCVNVDIKGVVHSKFVIPDGVFEEGQLSIGCLQYKLAGVIGTK